MSNVQEVIGRAVENLPGHWTKGSYIVGNDYCLLGHLGHARYQLASQEEIEHYYNLGNVAMGRMLWDDVYSQAHRLVESVIKEQYPEYADTLEEDMELTPNWNDERDRTLEEVLAILEKAFVKAGE